MRNLKKILALALALVMSLSLMATANAFTDDDSITDTYETAVTVLSGLKVFQGYDDGSFLPQGAITRAEVAAIIYRIVTGDVADTQVGIYADYNKFDDVASTSWYAGYVNFCANAEYIKGYDARTFGPNDPVTGYQALAMILRALGYDKNGEFTGTNWQVQTAAVGESRGITKNITAGTLGVPATREVVAEILFQAILVNTVNYTPAFGYREDDTSLGWETFELEDITGVVVANEYADLYDTEALDEGETRLDVDGTDYDIAYATTVEDLGEARHAYVTGETVLAISDAGNTVWTNEGAETDIGSDDDFEDVTGLENTSAEYFINFDGGTEYEASSMRIEYEIVFSASNGWTDALVDAFGARLEQNNGGDYDSVTNTYNKSIARRSALTAADMDFSEAIFTDSDGKTDMPEYIGEVYVGTQSATDISDSISYDDFLDEYITTSENSVEIDGADNGEWLKVVDNDGDGEADYVFLLEFAMSLVNRISRDGEYTLAALANDDEVAFNDTVVIDEADIATEDELAEGDVVIYTLIDGVYYVDLAEMVTETVDEDGINSKTETMTCGGTDYVQSHIGYTDRTTYYSDVTDAHTEVTYDLYLDHFGYVRLFIESDYSAFMLLTDGYYETDRRDEAFKAMYWNVEASEEQEIDVVGSDADDFITTADRNNDGDRETWRRLVDAGEFYLGYPDGDDTYITNIAGYSAGDDGYTLIPADDSTRRAEYEVQELDDARLDNDSLSDELLYNVDGGRVQTTTNTEYYLVIKATDRFGAEYVDDVITWTGYANVPDDAALAADAVAYAVTHDGDDGRWNLYDVADVVVFETDPTADHDTYFVYTHNNWSFTNPNPDPDTIEYVWGLGYNEAGEIEDQRIDVEEGAQEIHDNGVIEFYEIYDNTDADIIANNYAGHNIYAGQVSVRYDVSSRDYMQVDVLSAPGVDFLRFNPEEITIYKVTGATAADAGEYDVAIVENWDDIRVGYRMILVTDGDKNVEYAIAVSMSTYSDRWMTSVYTAVDDLYWDIVNDGIVETYDTAAPTVTTDGYDLKWGTADNVAFSCNVEYSAWSTWTADDVYTVSPADGNSIAIENLTTFTTADKTVAVDLPDLDDNDGHGVAGTQEIVVYSQGDAEGAVTVAYTFIINYLADTTGTDLYLQSDTTKTALNELTVYGGKVTNIENLKKEWYDHNGDKWNWTFYDKNGDVVTDEGTDTTALSHAEVTVTSADKASAKYVISFETVSTANVDALVASMLKDSSLTLEEIADDIWSESPSTSRVGDPDIIDAMLKAGVSVERIFREYGKDADEIADDMVTAGKTVNAVLTGYFDSLAVNGVVTLDSDRDGDALTITRSGNTFTVTVPEDTDEEISGTGIGSVATALSISVTSYTTTDGTNSYPGSTGIADIKADINNYLIGNGTIPGHKGAAQGVEWTATIVISSVTYTVNFVPAE